MTATETKQIAELTAQVAALADQLSKVTTQVTRPAPAEVKATVELTDKVYRRHIKSVGKFIKGGDAGKPIGYNQRKFLCRLGGKSVSWESFDDFTAGQAAVAIKLLKGMTPVSLNGTTVIPQGNLS